jgi:hypothetical protein
MAAGDRFSPAAERPSAVTSTVDHPLGSPSLGAHISLHIYAYTNIVYHSHALHVTDLDGVQHDLQIAPPLLISKLWFRVLGLYKP